MWKTKTRKPRWVSAAGALPAVAPARATLGPAVGLQRAIGNQLLQRVNATSSGAVHGAGTTGQPAVVERYLHDRAGRGDPLPGLVRAELEPRLGRDFGDVRMHHDAQADAAARSVGALAFTVGRDVVFRAGQYTPDLASGRRLLVHELVHVMQQSQPRGGAASPLHRTPGPIVQRQPQPAPRPRVIADSPSDQSQWRERVDRAVRRQFGLAGPELTGSRVRFVDQAEFARRFPAASLEEHLLTLFLSFDPHGILHYNRHRVGVEPRLETLRTFIQEGIRDGYFMGQTGEYDVTTRRPFPPERFTPRELVAEYIAGITDVSGPRASRSVMVQSPGHVDVLVHEACHFYVSERFRDMANARTDRNHWIGGARIGQILIEGLAEYFAREVMSAQAADFGVLSGHAYQPEVEQVWRLHATLGEATLRAAYFGGDPAQIQRVAAAIDEYKDTPDELLVPRFVIDVRLQQRAPAQGSRPVAK